MTGFPGRPTARPTGRLIFDALSRLHLIPATANAPPIAPAPPPGSKPASSNSSTSTRSPPADPEWTIPMTTHRRSCAEHRASGVWGPSPNGWGSRPAP
jgi:hypothetical protein